MPASSAVIYHLERRDIYKTEKPYIFAYDLPTDQIASTNHYYQAHDVSIQDAQGRLDEFCLDVHGFAFSEFQTELFNIDFDSNSIVEEKYLPRVLEFVQNISPLGTELRILNHVRRKRAPTFPNERETTGAGVLNPIIVAHADYTENGAKIVLQDIYKQSPNLQGCKFDIINIWRPTDGPCVHWPLALCDFQGVVRNDVEITDVLHTDHVGESVRLFANPTHRWHYLDNQTPDQVIIFRSAAMNDPSVPFCIHSAFARSEEDTKAYAQRQSIEVRVVRFFT